MNEQQPRALTEREVATRLNLSVATLRAWRVRRRGPRFVRLGRCVRYLAADVEQFIEGNAVACGPDQLGAAIRVAEKPIP